MSALVAHAGAGPPRLFSANGVQGGLLARDPSAGLAVAEQSDHGVVAGRPGAARLEVATLGGREALLCYGAAAGVRGWWLDGTGTAGGFAVPFALAFGDRTCLAVEALSLGAGRDLVLTSSVEAPGVQSWLRGTAGQVGQPVQLPVGSPGGGADILDIASMACAGGGLALVLSAATDALTAYRIDAGGRCWPAFSIPRAGSGSTRRTSSRRCAWARATSSSSAPRGPGRSPWSRSTRRGFTALDQVNDDLRTRFQGIAVLEAVTIGDRAFVITGAPTTG